MANLRKSNETMNFYFYTLSNLCIFSSFCTTCNLNINLILNLFNYTKDFRYFISIHNGNK